LGNNQGTCQLHSFTRRNKKLIRRWYSEREVSLHCIRTRK